MRAVSVTSRSAVRARARAAVASSCRACREPISARRSTRRFCSGRCRIAHWRGALPAAHQRRIRECEAERDPRPVMVTLNGCTVAEIAYAEAKTFVTRYEWLGSMPPVTRACYGLKTPDGELAGVVVFAAGPSPESGDLCGCEHRDKAICLARGACAHWAHPHAASFLIARACKAARNDHGWTVFYAYSDPLAGEIGTIYQACNWLYLGTGTGRSEGRWRWRFYDRRAGRWLAERGLRRPRADWIVERTPDKGRYVWLADRRLRQALKYQPQAYPKRPSAKANRAPLERSREAKCSI
jgi:hypothetical protein